VPGQTPLTAQGFYTRTLVAPAFDGSIRVRRYLCEACRRTVSLLPEFALPYLRSSVTAIALFLVARLLHAKTLAAALPPSSPYQRGQFSAPAPDFVHRALAMLESIGWIPSHRFLFASLRQHLLGRAYWMAPKGRRAALAPAAANV